MLTDKKGNFADLIGLNIDEKMIRLYKDYYYKTDIFLPQNSQKKINPLEGKEVRTNTDIMTLTTFKKSEFYQDFLKKDNFYHEAAIYLTNGEYFTGGIGILRDRNDGRFTDKDLAVLSAITPYISKSFSDYLNLCQAEQDQRLLRSCIDNLPFGIVFIDHTFSVVSNNQLASDYCRDIQNNLPQAGKSISETLHLAFSNIKIEKGIPIAVITTQSDNYRFKFYPLMLPDNDSNILNYYIAHIIPEDKKEEETYRKRTSEFGLTARETEIVDLIAKGFNNKEIAAKLCISYNTARTHVENILNKLDITNRTAILSTLGIVKTRT